MSKESSSRSRKRSATEALAANIVQFPPALLSDFVIHHRSIAYHVHKFVLFHHSSYFRSYIEQLTDGQRAYPTEECDEHPSVTHCSRLPDSCGKLEATADDFRLFLCHLYFAQHYCCIPYTVAAHIDVSAELPPTVNLAYPDFRSWEPLRKATSSIPFSVSQPAVYESVMSLCHYFDCAVVLARAEHNMLLVVGAYTNYETESKHGQRG